MAGLAALETWDDALDIRILRGECQGVFDRSFMRDVDGAGEFTAFEDLTVPIGSLAGEMERVVRVDAKHYERKNTSAASE